MDSSRTIGLVLLKDDDIEEITINDLFEYGTAAKILKKLNLPDGGINVLINSIKRFKVKKIISEKPYFITEVEYLEDEQPKKNIEVKALTRSISLRFSDVVCPSSRTVTPLYGLLSVR